MTKDPFEPVTMDVVPIEAIRTKHMSTSAMVFRLRSQDGEFDITEIPCNFPVPLEPVPALASAGRRSRWPTSTTTSGIARQMSLPPRIHTGTGLVATDTSVGFVNSVGDFYIQYPQVEGMHKVASGVKQALANRTHFCLVTIENSALLCDAAGAVTTHPDSLSHVRRVVASERRFVIQTDTGFFVGTPCGNMAEVECLGGSGTVLDVQVQGDAFAVLTSDGRVWFSDTRGFVAGEGEGMAEVVQMHATESEVALLTAQGLVFSVPATDHTSARPVEGLSRATALVGVTVCVMAVHESGELYAWSGDWFKGAGWNGPCLAACSVYGLNINDVALVSVNHANWLLGLRDNTFFSLGEHTHIGPVVGVGVDRVPRTVTNAGSHAMVRDDGSVCVIGSADHGGVNEGGMYGVVDTSHPVTEVCGQHAAFVALLEPFRASARVWGTTTSAGEIEYGAPVEHVYITPSHVYAYTAEAKLFRDDEMVLDIDSFVPGGAVAYLLHNCLGMYVAVADGRRDFRDSMCNVAMPRTAVMDVLALDHHSHRRESESESESEAETETEAERPMQPPPPPPPRPRAPVPKQTTPGAAPPTPTPGVAVVEATPPPEMVVAEPATAEAVPWCDDGGDCCPTDTGAVPYDPFLIRPRRTRSKRRSRIRSKRRSQRRHGQEPGFRADTDTTDTTGTGTPAPTPTPATPPTGTTTPAPSKLSLKYALAALGVAALALIVLIVIWASKAE